MTARNEAGPSGRLSGPDIVLRGVDIMAGTAPRTTTNATPATTTTTTTGSSLKARVSGTIVIGTVNVPISTDLPPTTPGTFLFDYEAKDPKNPDVSGSVGEFVTWLGTELGIGITSSDLPTSLASLSFGLVTLKFNTSFTVFDAIVLMGTLSGGTFAATWTPITDFPKFQLNDIKLEAYKPTS